MIHWHLCDDFTRKLPLLEFLTKVWNEANCVPYFSHFSKSAKQHLLICRAVVVFTTIQLHSARSLNSVSAQA